MSAVRRDLVATCWTSAGSARPGDPSERSPYDPLVRLEAVAAAGFMGMGFVLDDLRAIREGIGFAALRARAEGLGIQHLEVEVLSGWWVDGADGADGDEGADGSWRADWDLLREAASVLGSPFVKIAPPPGVTLARIDPLVEPLRRLAREAAAAGTSVALETLPFAAVATLPQGAELMRAVDDPHAGLVVDFWHVFRAGTSLAELEASLDPAMILGVEIDDADAAPQPGRTLFEDTRDNRRYPGEGAQDVPGFVRTMSRLGFDGPWGVEMLSDEHRHAPLAAALRRTVRSTLRCLDEAEEADPAGTAPTTL